MQKRGRQHVKEVKEFEEEVIQLDRVTRVVKGGRRLRFRATVVVGNRKGKVGVGIGKSTEVTGAIQKAIAQAKKAMVEVPMAGQTIPHRIQVKFKSAKLLLMPACPGTGIIAGGPLRKIVELSGVQDILSKSLGCNNRVTNSQAAIMALARLQQIPWLKKKATTVATVSAPKFTPTTAGRPPMRQQHHSKPQTTAPKADPKNEKKA
ncbi:30S ribosomal protein S5 [Candidatus Peregrinibacteria bacterium]|nr:30S ribosomal protein S5 [Candidatus Peregrinibacteria bacterium]